MTAAATVSAPIRVTGEFPVGRSPMPKPARCVAVILGAGGDLAHRKLLPALFHLFLDGGLPDEFAIVGVERDTKVNDEGFRTIVIEALRTSGIQESMIQSHWSDFARRLFYFPGDLGSPDTYNALRARLGEIDRTVPDLQGHLFHLALPPSLYTSVIRQLAASGLLTKSRDPADRPWTRVVIEKPFGHDGASANALQRAARRVMAEHQLYRIDHYLGKETVQNLLVLRFANSIFETVWNRHYVDSVQITASETLGVEHRGRYYEEAGIIRDMFQNHLLQLVTLTAMEPPTAFAADPVRDEKVKVLRAIKPVHPGARCAASTALARSMVRWSPAIGRKRMSPKGRTRRPTRRCSSASITGGGRACRSSCAPESEWRYPPRKLRFASAARR